MKHHLSTLTFLAIAALLLSCTKEYLPVVSPAPAPGTFAVFTEPSETAVTYSASDGSATLSVTGVTVSHSHAADILLTATLTLPDGSSKTVTDKVSWKTPTIDPISADKGTVRSDYHDIHDIPYNGHEPGIIPETVSYVNAIYKGEGVDISVHVPVIFRRTVYISVTDQCKFNYENGTQYEFRPVASHPVPYTVNVAGMTPFGEPLIWQIATDGTTDEYQRGGTPVRYESETERASINFVCFNDADSSKRLYVPDEKTTYILTTERFDQRR